MTPKIATALLIERVWHLLQAIRLGSRIVDKTRLTLILFLDVVMFPEQRRLPKSLDDMIKKLWSQVCVQISGIHYALVDLESFEIIVYGERFMEAWFKPEQGDVIVDVGAHIGKYTLKAAERVGRRGQVIAVEPDTKNYDKLAENVYLNKLDNVVPVNLAAWNEETKLKLFTGEFAGRHSVKVDWHLGCVEVEAQTIDRILARHSVTRVDIVKIDVEGAECEVLSGMQATIHKHKPKIIVEASVKNFWQIKQFLKEREYELIKISPQYQDSLRNFIHLICLPWPK